MSDTILSAVKAETEQATAAVGADLEQLVTRDKAKAKNWLARNATGFSWGFAFGAAVVAGAAALIRVL